MLPFRAIICLDVDCFEQQVWGKHLYREYIDQDIPIVIVNPDKAIVSINYSARAPKYGIRRRRMSRKEFDRLKRGFPEVKVLETGRRNNQCDTFTPFKECDVIMNVVMEEVMKYRGVVVERASCDGVCLDITDALPEIRNRDRWASNDQLLNGRKRYPCKEYDGTPKAILFSDVVATTSGYHTGQDIRISKNVVPSEEESIIRAGIFSLWLLDVIYKKTGYYCSAGVGPNKLIAKVASDLNKPAGVAMMTTQAFIRQTASMPYDKLPGLKRNTGIEMRGFYTENMRRPLKFISQIQELSLDHLRDFYYGNKDEQDPWKKAKTLYDSVRGIDSHPVKHKLHDNCVGFSYKFRVSRRACEQDVKNLAKDMVERFDHLVKHQKRLPEFLSLRIKFKTKDKAGEITTRFPVNPELRKLDPRVLARFIHHSRITNDIDLEIVQKFQFRAMDCKPFT